MDASHLFACRTLWNSFYILLTKLNVFILENLKWIPQSISSLALKNVSHVRLARLRIIEGLITFFLWVFLWMKLLIKVLCTAIFFWDIIPSNKILMTIIWEFRRTGSIPETENGKDFRREGCVSLMVLFLYLFSPSVWILVKHDLFWQIRWGDCSPKGTSRSMPSNLFSSRGASWLLQLCLES